jgi:hypothetical protein
MPVRARRSRQDTLDFGHDEEPVFGALDAGERICPPHMARAEGGTFLPSLILVLVVLGGGGAILYFDPDLPLRLKAHIAALAPAAGHSLSAALVPSPPAPPPIAPPPAPAAELLPPPPAPVAREIADAPGAPAKADAEITTGALPPTPAEAADAPLPPPRLDPSDPYQKRAAAVGLHPEVSRVLLRRMSAADYRNAGDAIKTAIAKTPDDGIFVWPRQRKPADALFRVHFVPGAAPHCRRYVVTVTKDGWSTTAPPMEKCDASFGSRKSS